MPSAGWMNQSARFERQDTADDGHGNETAETWTALPGLARFSAYFRPEFGSERVEAGRLESTMRGNLSVRSCVATRGVSAADRIVLLTTPYEGLVFQIRAVVPTPDRAFIEFVVEQNVAQ